MPVQIDRSGLASLPSLAQLLLDTVDFSPVIDRRNSRNSEAASRRNGLAGGIGGGCLPKARLTPDVLVTNDLVPVLANSSSLGESGSIEVRQNVDGELGRKSGDEVDCADSNVLLRLVLAFGTGESDCDSDATLSVIALVVGAGVQPHVVKTLTGKVLVLHGSRCLCCSPGVAGDNRWLAIVTRNRQVRSIIVVIVGMLAVEIEAVDGS